MELELNRRNFLKGALVTGGLIAATGLVGCVSSDSGSGDGAAEVANDATQEVTNEEIVPSETMDCDICIVGAGLSGLSACVQAGELGATVVALESTDSTGGGGRVGVEGSFGLGSSMFKEKGIEIDKTEILRDELSQSQQRADATLWLDLMDVAGENIDWLVGQGVEFSGEIDNYHTGKFDVFHWYKNGHCAEGYVPPMTTRAEELGVQFVYQTSAKQLIQDESGKVVGVYAQNEESGEWVQVNAKAVVLATGGIGSNPELVARIGYDAGRIGHMFEFAKGDGYQMAMSLGAKDMIPGCCDQNAPMIPALPQGQSNMLFGIEPEIPWVNQDCKRFYAEDIVVSNMSYSNPPKWNQKDYFMIWDQKVLDTFDSWGTDGNDIPALIEEAVQTDNGSVYAADSFAELAEKFGLDGAALEETVSEYNRMCSEGKDELFGKDPQYMQALDTPPYYMARPIWVVFCVVGCIGTDHNAQVITPTFDPIPGLYAIGNDGCMLYRNIYTIDTPGTCSGWGIASGRKAVSHAYENYVK